MAVPYQVAESTRLNRRQQKLWSIAYVPQKPRAVLVWHHGVGESNDRSKYKTFFDAFAKHGIAVYAQDAHGMGKSEPTAKADRVFVRSVDHLVDDAEDFATEARAKHPEGTPCFVGGVSMGGMISTLLALRQQEVWRGIVLQSAAINVEKNFLQRLTEAMAGILSVLVPRARIVPAVPPEYLSKDPQVRKDTMDDPYTVVGNMKVATGVMFLQGFAQIAQTGSSLSLPIFAIHGTEDKVTSPKAVRALLDGCASKDKVFVPVEGGYHELIMGAGTAEATQHHVDWLLKHLPS